jgi:hypothetical protein
MALRRLSAISCIALLTAVPAWAYRPYDSTDADVADENEIELEVGWEDADFDGENARGVRAVLNFGLGREREIVVEGGWLRTQPSSGFEGARSSVEGVGAFLKQVHRHGSLQGKSGLSVASECGALIPTRREDSGVGGECLLVASQEVSAVAIHFNVGLAYETSHRWSRFMGLIIERAGDQRFKPGVELAHERSEGGAFELSALAGVTWSVTDGCAFDVAHRWGLQSSSDLHEWRVGLTWTH